MATAPTFSPQMMALGSIGNAINAYTDRRAAERVLAQQTQQLRDRIAFDRRIMEEQVALRAQEVARQQMLAQAAGGAFADSLGQFRDVQGDIDARAGGLSEVFRAALARPAPQLSAPTATGMTADYEAAARAKQSADMAQEADRLAVAQAFGQTMTDKGFALSENEQLAALLRNFGAGSQRASTAEIASREGRLYQPTPIQQAPSMLGDLFVGLGSIGLQAAQKPAEAPSPYAIGAPQGTQEPGLRMTTGGVGLRTDRPAGLGIRTR